MVAFPQGKRNLAVTDGGILDLFTPYLDLQVTLELSSISPFQPPSSLHPPPPPLSSISPPLSILTASSSIRLKCTHSLGAHCSTILLRPRPQLQPAPLRSQTQPSNTPIHPVSWTKTCNPPPCRHLQPRCFRPAASISPDLCSVISSTLPSTLACSRLPTSDNLHSSHQNGLRRLPLGIRVSLSFDYYAVTLHPLTFEQAQKRQCPEDHSL